MNGWGKAKNTLLDQPHAKHLCYHLFVEGHWKLLTLLLWFNEFQEFSSRRDISSRPFGLSRRDVSSRPFGLSSPQAMCVNGKRLFAGTRGFHLGDWCSLKLSVSLVMNICISVCPVFFFPFFFQCFHDFFLSGFNCQGLRMEESVAVKNVSKVY